MGISENKGTYYRPYAVQTLNSNTLIVKTYIITNTHVKSKACTQVWARGEALTRLLVTKKVGGGFDK